MHHAGTVPEFILKRKLPDDGKKAVVQQRDFHAPRKRQLLRNQGCRSFVFQRDDVLALINTAAYGGSRRGTKINRHLDLMSREAQALVKKWQAYITANYYNCTTPILSCLGQMYVGDERFTQNIDKFGAGTAAFMAAAIEMYCRRDII